MMYYSDDLIEEIRLRNDIVDVISTYVKLQKKGSSYFGLCPFHNEKSPSFSVSPQKQMYYCFGCGAGGNVITFIMEYENYSFLEAIELLANRAGIELPKVEATGRDRQKEERKAQLLEVNKLAAGYYFYQLKTPNGKAAYDYLKNRELSDETIKKFGLGYSSKYSNDLYQYLKKKGYQDELLKESGLFTMEERGVHDKFWNRVMFPILDVNQKVIGFGGRVMGDGKPKYLNSPETKIFDKSRNLYGLHAARVSRAKNIIICEGYMDVIALHQAGFTNAVASLGTAFTSGQASLLKRYATEVLLTYDSDEAGIKAALRSIPILKEAGIQAKVVRMEPYKDPDEFIKHMGADAFRQRMEEATNSFLFELEVLQKNYNMKDPEDKTRFFKEVAKRLVEFRDELERNNYIEAVAAGFHVDYDHLRKLVNQYGNQIGIMREPERPKAKSKDSLKKEEGLQKSNQILLTWLIENPDLFRIVRKYLTPDDFVNPLYHKVAVMLYEQAEGGALNPASIISCFPEAEEQKQIAALFHSQLQVENKEEKEKALKETIYKVKQSSIEYHNANLQPTDLTSLQKIVEDKKALEDLRRLHISLD